MSNILNRLFDFELKEENKLTSKYLFCWALISFVVLIILQAWYLYQDNYLPFTVFCAPLLFIAIVDFDAQAKRGMHISAIHFLHVFVWFLLFLIFRKQSFFALKLSVWFASFHLALTCLYILLPVLLKRGQIFRYNLHLKSVFLLLSVQVILILLLKVWTIQVNQVWPYHMGIKNFALYGHLFCSLLAIYLLVLERRSIKRIRASRKLQPLFPVVESQSEWVVNLELKLDQYMRSSKAFLSSELSLNDLSRELDIPRHRLSHYLNEHLGLNYYEWLGSYRVAHAMELLKGKGEHWKIEILAHECGYQSKTTFIKHFKSTLGVTPSQFRLNSLQWS